MAASSGLSFGPPWLFALLLLSAALLGLGSLARHSEGPPAAHAAQTGAQTAKAMDSADAQDDLTGPPADFLAQVIDEPAAAAEDTQHSQRKLAQQILPWVTEGSFALLLGLFLGSFHKKQFIAFLVVAVLVAGAVISLEQLDLVQIAWADLGRYIQANVYAPPLGEVAQDAPQKGTSIALLFLGAVLARKF